LIIRDILAKINQKSIYFDIKQKVALATLVIARTIN